jgi:hypothetical protein
MIDKKIVTPEIKKAIDIAAQNLADYSCIEMEQLVNEGYQLYLKNGIPQMPPEHLIPAYSAFLMYNLVTDGGDLESDDLINS